MVATAVVGMGFGGISRDPMSIAMSPDEQKIASDHLAQLKAMADDPKQVPELKHMIAKVLVMQEMSKMMAEDPQFKSSAVAYMGDPKVKQAHDDAQEMSRDPEQMKKLEQEIVADPVAMKVVMHRAIILSSMPDKMPDKTMQASDKK
jgi:hypothetical protein